MTKHPRECACRRCKAVDDVLAQALVLAEMVKRHRKEHLKHHMAIYRLLERGKVGAKMESASLKMLDAINVHPQKVKQEIWPADICATPTPDKKAACGLLRKHDGLCEVFHPAKYKGFRWKPRRRIW